MRSPTAKAWIIFTALSTGLPAAWLASSAPALARPDEPSATIPQMPAPAREWTFASEDAQWNQITRQLGKPAPALVAKSWTPAEAKPEDLRGQIVVYDFWATWCGPCIKSIPHNNEIAAIFAPQGVKLVGVCARQGGETMAKVANQYKMAYPTGFDSTDASSRAFGVQWYPYYVIVDRNGIVRAAGLKPDRVDDVLQSLLKEQPLTKSSG